MGYSHASKLLKLAFLTSLTRTYVFWKGFYHNFSTKKASASGGELCPLDPRRGRCPLDPEDPLPPLTIDPGAAPAYTMSMWEPPLRKEHYTCYSIIMWRLLEWMHSHFYSLKALNYFLLKILNLDQKHIFFTLKLMMWNVILTLFYSKKYFPPPFHFTP